LAAVAASLVLLVAACGDDGGSPFGTGPATTSSGAEAGPTTAAEPGETTALPGDTTTSPAAPTGPAPAGGDIDDLLERYRTVPLRTTYRFGEGDDEQVITLSQDPTADPPVSAMILDEGKLVDRGDETIICGMGGPGDDACIQVPGGAGSGFTQMMFNPLLLGLLALENVASAPGFSVEEGSAQVAGRNATCFTFSPRNFVGSDVEWVRQCVDAELGFALLVEVQERGGSPERVMELLEVGDPQPGDFEATGPIMDMPTP
jgi:hypothetical protein